MKTCIITTDTYLGHDTGQGHPERPDRVTVIIDRLKKIKSKKTTLCAGNIATSESAKFLIKLGVDVIKVGIGPGSICTTRLVAGIGVPQLSAILEVKKGTLVLLHGRLPHYSCENKSSKSRHAYTTHIIDGRASYPDTNWLQRPNMPLKGFVDE